MYQLARALCLAGAVAAEVQPIDTVYPDFRDSAGLEKTCARARMDSFTGKIAIHPDQVAVIQRAFSADTGRGRARAPGDRRVSREPGSWVRSALDGQMLDKPHLTQAERVSSRWRARLAAAPHPVG